MKSIFLLFLLISSQYLHAQTRPRVALVLSGGGAKGIAHISVIRLLESKGIKPDIIVGTSMGALVGGIYAMGYTPDQMEQIVKESDWDYLLNDQIKRDNFYIGQSSKDKNSLISLPLDGFKIAISSGLHAGQNIQTMIELLCRDYGSSMDFDDLPIPYRCVATDIETGEMKVIESGRMSDAMRASMSIPTIFSPKEINGVVLVDGGLINNFPTDIAKDMGADIIIGVDVGSSLYKREELNSLLKIMEQSISFYNATSSQKNNALCDIYIHPQVTSFNALAFDQADTILALGWAAAVEQLPQIDSVFSAYQLEPIVHPSKSRNTNLAISSLSIQSKGRDKLDKHFSIKMIKGKLGIEAPSVISEAQLSNSINRLYGSRLFEDISLQFIKTDTAYKLGVSAVEKKDDEFFFGARYDITYGINLLFEVNLRNVLIHGSLFEASVVAGESPQVKVRFTNDRGSKIGLGTSFQFDQFFTHSYHNHQEFSKYIYDRLVWDVFAQSMISQKKRLLVGVEASIFGLLNTQAIGDLQNINRMYGSLFSSLVIDNWNRSYYPQKGTQSKFRGDLIMQEDGSLLTTLWGRSHSIIRLRKNIAIEAKVFVGLGSRGTDSTIYRYFTGGMASNRIQWYNPFPGLNYLEHGRSNIWIVGLSPRWEFLKNHFLTYTFAVEGLDAMPEHLLINPQDVFAGMSLKYGYYSLFGPIEFSWDYGLQYKTSNFFLSLGFWF
jgi:NTE family protein